jgi:methyl-accepting chemotaxis protein
MNVRRKLLAGFLAVGLTTLALGAYAVWSQQQLVDITIKMYDRALMTATFSQSARAAFFNADRALRDAMAARSMADFEQAQKAMDAADQGFLEDLDVVRDRALDAESLALVADIRRLHDEWKQQRTPVLEGARSRLGGRTVPVAVAPAGRTAAAEMEEKLLALVEHAAQVGFQFRESSSHSGRRLLRITYAGVALALGIGVGVAVLLGHSIVPSLRLLGTQLRELAAGEGDLRPRITSRSRDEIGDLAHWSNVFLGNLQQIVGRVRASADGVAAAAGAVADGGRRLSAGQQEQVAALEETAGSVTHLTATVRENAERAGSANHLAGQASMLATRGAVEIREAVDGMRAITQSASRVADIVSTIQEVAFQTNLLALNAAVEAARAGEQGRGFAVVAAEVRSLAQRSATSAREIKALIEQSLMAVDSGALLVQRSGATLEEIVSAVSQVARIMAEIARASEDQAREITQINGVTAQISRVTQASAAETVDLASTGHQLVEESRQLQELVGRFHIDDGEALAVVPNALPTVPALGGQPSAAATAVRRSAAYVAP